MADRFISVMGGHIFHCWADGIKAKDVIGYGTSGYVALLPNSNEVIKVPHPGDADAYIRCAREIEVYKRFETTGGRRPQSIVGYKGLRDDGSLRLEYAAGGNFKQHLSNLRDKIRIQDCFRWAKQAAQSLVFCHSNSVLHGDICCNNFFLDQYLNLKLGDFAGSSIDQLPALVCYHTTHQLPGIEDLYAADEVRITIETEIFAFGSFLYEMSAGIRPYESLTDGEIEKRFRQRSFPDVTRLKLGPVIASCWNLKFHTMAEVLEAIENTSRCHGDHQEMISLHIIVDY